MVARRMLLIVAILMGITALTAGLAAPPRPRAPDPAPEAADGAADATPLQRTLDAGDRQRTLTVEQGDHLVLTVRADTDDAVEVVGLDRLAPVAPGTPAVFDVLADRPGLYPVALAADGRRLGALRVTPAPE